MTGPDDPYLAAAEAYVNSAIEQMGMSADGRRAFLLERALTRPQLRAAVDAARQPLLDANQQLTDRIAELEAEVYELNDRISVGELERGEGRRFQTGAEAVAWLKSDDDE